MRWKLLVAIVLVLAVPGLAGAVPTCEVSGKVYNVDSTPAEGAMVTFEIIEAQNIAGETIAPTLYSSLVDSNADMAPVELPQGAYLNLTVGLGDPKYVQVPLTSTVDLSSLVASYPGPPAGNYWWGPVVVNGGTPLLPDASADTLIITPGVNMTAAGAPGLDTIALSVVLPGADRSVLYRDASGLFDATSNFIFDESQYRLYSGNSATSNWDLYPLGLTIRSTLQPYLRVTDSGGTNTVGIMAPSSVPASWDLTLPSAPPGSTGLCMVSTDTAGATSWQACGGGGGGATPTPTPTPTGATPTPTPTATLNVWTCAATGNCDAVVAAAGDTFDAGSADSSKPAKRGTSLPATCAVGDFYQKTNDENGQVYVCTATNNWIPLESCRPLGTYAAASAITTGGATGPQRAANSLAVQSVFDTIGAGAGGCIQWPEATIEVDSTISYREKGGLTIVGSMGALARSGYSVTAPFELSYTGTTRGLDLRGSIGVALVGMFVRCDALNSGGTCIDLDEYYGPSPTPTSGVTPTPPAATPSPVRANYFTLTGSSIKGPLAAGNTCALIRARNTVGGWVDRSTLTGCGYHFYGPTSSSDYANVWSWTRTAFYYADTCSIQNPSSNASFRDGWWQQQGASGNKAAAICQDFDSVARGIVVQGNGFYDLPVGATGSWITIRGRGWNVSGNLIGGQSTSVGIEVAGTDTRGFTIRDNSIEFPQVPIKISGTAKGGTISGNTLLCSGTGAGNIAVSVTGTASGLAITGNSFWSCNQGIGVTGTLSAPTLSSNVFDTITTKYSGLSEHLFIDGPLYVDNAGGARFYESDSNGSNYISMLPPSSLANNLTLTLPASTPDVDGLCWKANSDGTTYFGACGGGTPTPTVTSTAATPTPTVTVTPTPTVTPTRTWDAFAIASPGAGTAPVADTETDTLSFIGAGGLTITGDSSADSLTFAIPTPTVTVTPTPTAQACPAGQFVNGRDNAFKQLCAVLPTQTPTPTPTPTVTPTPTFTTGGGVATVTPTPTPTRTWSAFAIASPGAGTAPVSDTEQDTLSFIGAGGLTITGDATGDSLTFTIPTPTVTVTPTPTVTVTVTPTAIACPAGQFVNGRTNTYAQICAVLPTLTPTPTPTSTAATPTPTVTRTPVWDAFAIVHGDAGTDPTADQNSDTLTIVGAGGILVTGTAGTDTITIAMPTPTVTVTPTPTVTVTPTPTVTVTPTPTTTTAASGGTGQIIFDTNSKLAPTAGQIRYLSANKVCLSADDADCRIPIQQGTYSKLIVQSTNSQTASNVTITVKYGACSGPLSSSGASTTLSATANTATSASSSFTISNDTSCVQLKVEAGGSNMSSAYVSASLGG